MRNRAARLTKPDWEAFDQTPKLKLAGGLRCRSRPSGISWTVRACARPSGSAFLSRKYTNAKTGMRYHPRKVLKVVLTSAIGTKRTCRDVRSLSAFGGKADI